MIDTTGLSVHQLAESIREKILGKKTNNWSLPLSHLALNTVYLKKPIMYLTLAFYQTHIGSLNLSRLQGWINQ